MAKIDRLLPNVSAGTTTRSEIISILGKPDLERDRYFIYLRRLYCTDWVFKSCPPANQAIMDLYFEFDNYGTLTDYRADKYDYFLRPVK